MGIRIGAPAMTSRGLGEKDFAQIADYIDQCIKIAQKVQSELPKEANKQKDFKAKIASGEVDEIKALKAEIAAWAGTFPLPI
jgi:glycine hydroxymethyltransferase